MKSSKRAEKWGKDPFNREEAGYDVWQKMQSREHFWYYRSDR
jgi:hypothetical protein